MPALKRLQWSVELKASRAGQPALVQGRAGASDPGVDEELVLVDQILPVQLGRELAAAEEHAGRGGRRNAPP
jgi:hypothetical protein